MTDQEKLNAILRLRLFFSTESELSQYIEYKLKSNHFYRFNTFKADAYYSKFARLCSDYTMGKLDLDTVIEEYEATSKFYKHHVEGTAHERRKGFVTTLLERVFLGAAMQEEVAPKDATLCERYAAESGKEKRPNIGMLLLMAYGLLPTFKNKRAQDVKDIVGDFQRAYEVLMEIAQSRKHRATTIYNEMLCLKEMRCLIDEAKAGDRYLNRLLLIDFTNTTLARIFALEDPVKQQEYSNELQPMDFVLPRFWRAEGEADNVVWEFVEQDINCYFLFRNEIDFQGKHILFTKYQLFFRDYGLSTSCYTIIMRPAFIYHNLLRWVQPDDAITFDFTDFEYDEDGKTLKQMRFTIESPLGAAPLTLKPVKSHEIRYYRQYIDHTVTNDGFDDQDQWPQFSVYSETVKAAVSEKAIVFSLGRKVYRLDKYDDKGNETVPGIHVLTQSDNYVIASLMEGGREHRFLCLDSINQNLDMNWLMEQTYFREIKEAGEVF